MNCQICGVGFYDGERITFNKQETFIFKPADIKDTVNAAKVSPEELTESRKKHLKTEVATVFHLFGKAPIPEGAFNLRHATCGVSKTAGVNGTHPLLKHSIRYQRSIHRRVGRAY